MYQLFKGNIRIGESKSKEEAIVARGNDSSILIVNTEDSSSPSSPYNFPHGVEAQVLLLGLYHSKSYDKLAFALEELNVCKFCDTCNKLISAKEVVEYGIENGVL